MTFGIGISFPVKPTEKDIKKISEIWPMISLRWWMVEKQSQNQNQQIQMKQNPPATRIEVHGGHHKLVVKNFKNRAIC